MSRPRISAEQHRKAVASANLAVKLNDYQQEHGLTDAEMLQAVVIWMGTVLKYSIRAEREESE